jgi:hypothetical protein
MLSQLFTNPSDFWMPYDTSEAFHNLKALVLSTKPLHFIDVGEGRKRIIAQA